MKIRVYYEDTDAGEIVYHSNYLNFCERARSEMFFEKGLSPHGDNEFFVASKLEANFISSAKLGDMLTVTTKLIESKRASLTIMQEISKDGKIIYSQKVRLAFLKNNKPSAIPQEQLNILTGDDNV